MRRAAADVLVLGAGLAGLRAALSCLIAAPGLSVLVASLSGAPAGSSFANANNALGIHVCLGDAQRHDFVRDVRSLAAGAFLDPELVDVLAMEGADRLDDLVGLGLRFVRDESGGLAPHASCFAPDSRRAYVFRDLAGAFAAFRSRLESLGCAFLAGVRPAAIPRDAAAPGAPAVGAVLVSDGPGEPLAVAAKVVVAALGGPGRLFAHSTTGPGVPGYALGLLARAGAGLVNAGYLQHMWHTLPGRAFWSPAELGKTGWSVLDASGRVLPFPEVEPRVSSLALDRRGHCPFAHGLPDAALDLGLARFQDQDGTVALRGPDGASLRVAPMAHASNGGARIDARARTGVPGLLACGECAGGMHGANRLGGAMVLATQVFGHRAGVEAAWQAGQIREADTRRFDDLARESLSGLVTDEAERRQGLAALATGLSRFAVLGGRPGVRVWAGDVRRQRAAVRDWQLVLSLETASAILDGLPAPR